MASQNSHRSLWRDWRTWAMLATILVPLGLLDTAHRYVGSFSIRDAGPWNRVVARDLTIWLSYLPFIPIAFMVARRVRLDDRSRLVRNGVLHLVAAMLFAYAHLVLVGVITSHTGLGFMSLRGVGGGPRSQNVTFIVEFLRYLRTNFTADFLVYWAIVGIFYASYYYAESKERQLRALQLEASLTAARLNALRSQLNPHFLFNTLNAISVLALKGRHTDVVDMLARLSELLRFSLDDTRPQEIPLSDELEFLDGYLDIQKTRFADRLTIRREIEADTLQAAVPAMILQPIVENAIKHGVSEQCGAGYLAIRASRENGTLRLKVSDNGPGFSGPTPACRSNGIGLANTEARLRQMYGEAHGLEYGQSMDGGATVTISIPFRETGAAAASRADLAS